ncbi:hypothetical protein Taro_040469 [Colocasia esculenta]|uniref:Uncharacterized protein n=1 Tax=Colocasia esculenta TaxID=4460 RepID=A0A843WBZ3_COLES|nr:hypothetical protein [Colocasia esculenta]
MLVVLGARRSPSGSLDPWAATAKIRSSAWAEGRVLRVVTRGAIHGDGVEAPTTSMEVDPTEALGEEEAVGPKKSELWS